MQTEYLNKPTQSYNEVKTKPEIKGLKFPCVLFILNSFHSAGGLDLIRWNNRLHVLCKQTFPFLQRILYSEKCCIMHYLADVVIWKYDQKYVYTLP